VRRGRRGFLALGVAAVAGGAIPTPASAALPVPAPLDDDVGYLSFGVVAEMTSLAWYERTRSVGGFSAGERRRLRAAASAKRAHIERINTALGGDARRSGRLRGALPGGAAHAREPSTSGASSRGCSSAST
jgi:hypothetical protein